MTIDGHRLLIFADYSQEVSGKRRAFSPVCASLYNYRIKFILAYPAIQHVETPSGERVTFLKPEEAEEFVQKLPNDMQSSPQQTWSEQRNREGSPKRKANKEKRKAQATTETKGANGHDHSKGSRHDKVDHNLPLLGNADTVGSMYLLPS